MYTGLVTIFFVVLAWSSKPKHNLSMLANLSTLIIPTCRSTCRPTCVARISIGTRSLNCSVPTCWKLNNYYIYANMIHTASHANSKRLKFRYRYKKPEFHSFVLAQLGLMSCMPSNTSSSGIGKLICCINTCN